jgi:hypothetical protein
MEMEMHSQIIAAYETALAGRDPAGVDILDLLPAIEATCRTATVEDIILALEKRAESALREASQLRRYGNARKGQAKNARALAQDRA